MDKAYIRHEESITERNGNGDILSVSKKYKVIPLDTIRSVKFIDFSMGPNSSGVTKSSVLVRTDKFEHYFDFKTVEEGEDFYNTLAIQLRGNSPLETVQIVNGESA